MPPKKIVSRVLMETGRSCLITLIRLGPSHSIFVLDGGCDENDRSIADGFPCARLGRCSLGERSLSAGRHACRQRGPESTSVRQPSPDGGRCASNRSPAGL